MKIKIIFLKSRTFFHLLCIELVLFLLNPHAHFFNLKFSSNDLSSIGNVEMKCFIDCSSSKLIDRKFVRRRFRSIERKHKSTSYDSRTEFSNNDFLRRSINQRQTTKRKIKQQITTRRRRRTRFDFDRTTSSFLTLHICFSYIEVIQVYDGNATFRKGTPRSMWISKKATYSQILVREEIFPFSTFDIYVKLGFICFRRPHFEHSILMTIVQNIA